MVVPPIISMPATIFTKIYLDTMRMPEVDGVNAIIAARDDLSRVTEVRAVWSGDSEQAADFLWEQIYCRYGHFVLREALVKECDGDLTRWPYLLPHAAFTDRITVSRVTGVSPFYALHGVEPVLPLDLTEATFMVEGFRQGMSSVDLFVLRMRQLEKHPEELARASQKLIEHRLQSKEYFERRFHKRLRTGKEDAEYLKPGQWILIRNSAIEEQLNRKTMQRYIGPFIIVRQTRNGAWVIKDPDGTVHRRAVAAFRIVPYIARDKKTLRDLAAPDPELVNEILDEIMEEVEEMESDDDLFLNGA
ncbi:uncharacterized protein STEHIDRAFT_56242 [Stereum hirsutum FP-91666 SS1]|uniref:uncharacterized protein n=1 Tax=Stereum hirsutum (strain FP-91666) TaxID=721885 RepID=UPI000440D6EE|nr:uncharacterized protein STEHIDRAFT_56242 [Stereum hirsutum FP-91666 SS1]EIM87302.1 hypothetical protein STEHIDRAFT_56242 [Stereum hirsutum FP-91666 SS1]